MQIIKTGDSKEKLVKKLDRLNKTLNKYGYEKASILSETEIFINVESGMETENPEFIIPALRLRAYRWTIEIPVNKVGQDNTEFVAFLEFGSEAAGNRVIPAYEASNPSAASYDELLLTLAKSKKNNCDHCNTLRNRNKLFVFKKDGQVYTIGSTCAREWYGIEIEGFLSAWKSVSNFSDDEEGGFGNRAYSKMVYVSEILLYCMASIDRQGFISGKDVTNSTANDAQHCYNWQHNPEARHGAAPETLTHLRTSDKNFQEMVNFMGEWYLTYAPATLFDHNLRSGIIDFSLTAGMAPWAIKKWMDSEKLAYRTGNGSTVQNEVPVEIMDCPNKHVAEVGEKVSIEGQVVMTRAFDGDYGVSYLIKVATSEGMIAWFSSNFDFENCNVNDLIKGTKISITGKVKKLDAYQDTKQTLLTRCKLTMKEN